MLLCSIVVWILKVTSVSKLYHVQMVNDFNRRSIYSKETYGSKLQISVWA